MHTDPRTEAEVLGWLETFATAVRDVDYEAGRALFAEDVVGFGTVGVLLSGLETLMASQWKRVWGVTSGFCFDLDSADVRGSGDVAWVAVPWASRTGRSGRGLLDRRGRATYILKNAKANGSRSTRTIPSTRPAPRREPGAGAKPITSRISPAPSAKPRSGDRL